MELQDVHFDNFDTQHVELMAILAEQYLMHDEWDVADTGPLKRRPHDLHHYGTGTSTK